MAVLSPLPGLARRLRDSNLRLAVDSPIPATLEVGRGQGICVSGWCYHPAERIAALEILANGVPHPVKVRGMPRPDVAAAQGPDRDPRGAASRSGFWAFVPFEPVREETAVELRLRARLAGGRRCSRPIGTVELQPGAGGAGRTPGIPAAPPVAGLPVQETDAAVPGAPSPAGPRVAICMTTCDPPIDLFRAQVESIRVQTHANWTCVVVDDASPPRSFAAIREVIGPDARFRVHRNPARLGFYHNFERCLRLAPPEADFVTLSDHDDRWHPDKLRSLIAAFRPGTTLVYSDMNVVDRDGRLVSPTYWTTRRNNHRRFDSLLLANTITGAASMFPRGLLDVLLPFPPAVGRPFHDHWIGSVALALGDVRYVDRPLYDYVQHGGNALGHHAPPRGSLGAGVRAWWRRLAEPGRRATLRARAGALKGRWRAVYEADVLRLHVIARTLEMRCGDALTADRRRVLRRIAGMDQSALALAWLALRGLAPGGPGDVTLGAERKLAGAVLWRRLALPPAPNGGRR